MGSIIKMPIIILRGFFVSLFGGGVHVGQFSDQLLLPAGINDGTAAPPSSVPGSMTKQKALFMQALMIVDLV